MTPQQADEIARRIVNVWRSTPPIAEWRDVLQPMVLQHALDAFEQLRDSVDHSMSIARFRGEYAAIARRHDWQRPSYEDAISIDEYLRRHPDDELTRWRSKREATQ